MTTIADLVAQEPAADRGVPAGFPAPDGIPLGLYGSGTYGTGTYGETVGVSEGTWRHVVELADPAAGSSVEWFDITEWFAGYDYSRGADSYQSRYRASIVNLDLFVPDDRFAPWNPDTSPTFGVHVDLGPGLLIRSGFILVNDDTVTDWNPRFTCKVEFWGDASYSQGKVRQHRITARDTSTSLVGVPIGATTEENWADRIVSILTEAAWPYGYTIYGALTIGAVGILPMPDRTEQTSAINELDATCDPAGVIWYTNRKGQLIVRPTVYDTYHADKFDPGGAAGTPYPEPDLVTFAWWACTGETPPADYGDLDTTQVAAYALDTQGVEPFGLDRSELSVVNHVVVVSPSGTFDDDDPTSVQRYDRHTFQASWITANDFVAADILAAKANATVEAKPITTTIHLDGFQIGPSTVDFLDDVDIWHRNGPTGDEAHAVGWLRSYRELVRPLGCDTVWTMQVVLDVAETSARSPFLLPVEGLELTAVTDLAATFVWTNPTQVIEPTHTQVRMSPSALWLTTAYPITGLVWGGLAPYTPYEFEVRLIREVDGIITHFSPVRSVIFMTDDPDVPIVDVGDDVVDVTFPPPDEGCDLEWELQSSPDGTTWSTIDSGTVDGPAPYNLAYDTTELDPDVWYRFRSREVCDEVPGAWDVSDPLPFVGCLAVDRLGVPPFDDADLVAYWPQVCSDNPVEEAVSDQPMTLGGAFGGVAALDDGTPVMYAATEGVIGYGVQPVDVAGTSDLTISARISVGTLPSAAEPIIFGYGGLYMRLETSGGGFLVTGHCAEAGVGTITIGGGPTVMALETEYTLTLTHEVDGTLSLYIDGALEDASVSNIGERSGTLGGLYQIGAPADSYITDCAVWDTVLVPVGTDELFDAIMALSPVAYFPLRETSGTTIDDFGSLNAAGTVYGSQVALAATAGGDGFSYPHSTNASDSGIEVPDATAFSISDSGGLTVMCLVKLGADSTVQRVLVGKLGEWILYAGAFTDATEFYAASMTAGEGIARGRYTGTGILSTSQWSLCIARFNTSDFRPSLRVNGSNITGSTIASNTPGTNNSTLVRMLDLRHDGSTTGQSDLSIAHVAVFAGELSDGACATVEAVADAQGWY